MHVSRMPAVPKVGKPVDSAQQATAGVGRRLSQRLQSNPGSGTCRYIIAPKGGVRETGPLQA
jgi:hypothetical protein